VTADEIAALGAFLSGAGSVLGGWWVIRSVRKRAERICRQLILELRAEYDRGLDRGVHLRDNDEAAG